MPVLAVTRVRIDPEKARQIMHDMAPMLKQHGASHVRLGRIHVGQHTGQTIVTVAYENWDAYGKAQQAQHGDQKYQQLYHQATQQGEVQERFLLTVEDIN